MNPIRRSALALSLAALAATPALAEEKPAAGAADPMASWKPPKVVNEKKDRKEIEAFLNEMEAAGHKGSLEAAAALVDFPVLMVTDDSKGEGMGEGWSREQWVQVMKPFYDAPPPPDAMKSGKRSITLVTDSIALVSFPWTMKMEKQKVSGTSGLVLIRKGGAWKAKAFLEGGWGDMPMTGGEPPAQGVGK